jgi:hypothetical protein
VSGRLENAPTAAAPKAKKTSSVRSRASSANVGASRMPDRAAKHEPTNQEKRRTAAGLVPDRPSSAGSSTTAWTARPSFARVKKRYRPTTATKTTATMIICSTRTNVPPMS